MATKSKSNTKAKSTTKKGPTKGDDGRGRKIGERLETITERLTLGQIEEQRAKACDLMRAKGELKEKLKSIQADYKAKIAEVDSKLTNALGAAAAGKRDVEVAIEEWLTPRNQVQRYRKDTGELIGDRVARLDELQESLPGMGKKPDEEEGDDDDDAPTDVADKIAETAAAAKEAGDDDFGEGGEGGEN